MIESRTSHQNFQIRKMTGYSLENPSYLERCAMYHDQKSGIFISGCGGDIEVIHPSELLKSQHTGIPVKVTKLKVFGSSDTIRQIILIDGTDNTFIIHGDVFCTIIKSEEMIEVSTALSSRILRLPGRIVAINAEKQSKTELLICCLLETGIYHYSFCGNYNFQCIQAFRCTRPISSGTIWRDAGLLHIAYYDGFVRVGVIHEQYDDMLLVKRVALNRHNLPTLMDIVCDEIQRIQKFEECEKFELEKMLDCSKKIEGCLSEEDKDVQIKESSGEKFSKLKINFKNQTIRCERVTQRIQSLRKLVFIVKSTLETNERLESNIELLANELNELQKLEQLCEQVFRTKNSNLIGKSWIAVDEKRMVVDELIEKVNSIDTKLITKDWQEKMDQIIEQLNGSAEPPRDIRTIISESIFEHRANKNDVFTHFVLDQNSTEMTLYCLSGLTTLAIYPRKGQRAASISLDASFATKLTSAYSMKAIDGVYVADHNGVFPIYFYKEKRYLDAGEQLQIPTFDSISCILVEPNQMFLGSRTGGLLHLSFDLSVTLDHFIVASSMLAHPASSGHIRCLRLLPTGDTLLAIHSTSSEVVVSERENDRWHRITQHAGGAHDIAVTPFSLSERGAFAVVASKTYVRLKALQYAEESLIGLHDMGESHTLDESGCQLEVLSVSIDPTMQYRQLPCKLRYAVGYSDKAIRTYVAQLTGDHEFLVAEKFIAQIEPLFSVQHMICYFGRPMGCYVSCAKTLQVWSDLDRHQQKKLKSERMQLHKLSSSITSMERVDGYLILGHVDNKVTIYEEKAGGTLLLIGCIENWHRLLNYRQVTSLKCRITKADQVKRVFMFSMTPEHIIIHTAQIIESKLEEMEFITSIRHSMNSPKGFDFVPSKYFELYIYGFGLCCEKLNIDVRQKIDSYKEIEF